MKQFLFSLFIAVMALGFVAHDAEARRLGGGGSSGMQRSVPLQRSTPSYAQPAAPTQAPPMAAPMQQPRRSWMGPLAGLAAGFGLAALFSHFGFGGGLSHLLALVAIATIAVIVIRWIAGRGLRPQAAGMSYRGPEPRFEATPRNLGSAYVGSAQASSPAITAPIALPPDFDRAGFERIAKLIFIRMQTANDAGDLNDLRQFTTPEMFAAARLDLQERQGRTQKTDVVQLAADVIELARENGRDVVSVRYRGLIREDDGRVSQPAAETFDEIWHLVRPTDGSADWALAGIAQTVIG